MVTIGKLMGTGKCQTPGCVNKTDYYIGVPGRVGSYSRYCDECLDIITEEWQRVKWQRVKSPPAKDINKQLPIVNGSGGQTTDALARKALGLPELADEPEQPPEPYTCKNCGQEFDRTPEGLRAYKTHCLTHRKKKE